MEADMFEIQFDKFAEITRRKFAILWPSTKSTPPTEANISTLFTEIYSETHHCFSEVPLISGGRMDMVLMKKTGKEIVLCEFKSSKKNSLQELSADIERLDALSVEKAFYYFQGGPSAEVWGVIFQWAENAAEIDKNLEILSGKYPERRFEKKEINCDAPLYCLFSVWRRDR